VDDVGLQFLEKGCPLLKVLFYSKVIKCDMTLKLIKFGQGGFVEFEHRHRFL